MTISLFETRTMLEALSQTLPPTSFLRDTFFTGRKLSRSKNVDIDIYKGKRRIGVYVNPVMQAKTIDKIGFETRSYEPPYTKQKMITDAEDLLNRQFGKHVYENNIDPEDQVAMRVGEHLAELNELIDRLEENQCAEAMKAGTVTVSGDGIPTRTIDFGMPSGHKITLTGNDLWSDTTNADPFQNLRTWHRLIMKTSGVNPDKVIMDADASDAFIKHPKVTGALDLRRVELGIIKPELLPNGVTWMGFFNEIGCDIYQYNSWYADAAGTVTPILDSGRVLMGSTRARAEMLYGAIQDIDATFSVSRFPKSWKVEDPGARFIKLESAPLASLHQVDAFTSSTVL